MTGADDSRDEFFRALRSNVGESERPWRTVFLLSVFLGVFGADRFYIGRPVAGALKFISGGGGGAWWIYDVVRLLQNRMTDGEGRLIKRPF